MHIVKASSPPRCCELQLALEPARGELVRAFVREASLADGVPVAVANLIADDAAQAWVALCTPGSDRERRPRTLPRAACGALRGPRDSRRNRLARQ